MANFHRPPFSLLDYGHHVLLLKVELTMVLKLHAESKLLLQALLQQAHVTLDILVRPFQGAC